MSMTWLRTIMMSWIRFLQRRDEENSEEFVLPPATTYTAIVAQPGSQWGYHILRRQANGRYDVEAALLIRLIRSCIAIS
jgi:hypothetical protein